MPIIVAHVLTNLENFLLKAITAAKDRTGDATNCSRYSFKAGLNSSNIASNSPFCPAVIVSMSLICKLSTRTAPCRLNFGKYKECLVSLH
jgi:Trm5-related predicted tRNA methylase